VLLDVGMDLLGADGAVHRATVGLAAQVLFVVAADLVGLWRAQTGLKLLQTAAGVGLDRVALVVNRHDRRRHHGRAEVEWALGVATAAVVPDDPVGVQRAVAAQRPVVLEGKSRAGHVLLDLAERLHGGEVRLPPEPGKKSRFDWLARLRPRLSPPRLAVRPAVLRREAKGAAQRGD
jgi:Flp pilus assembly CpaE family ATPase